MLCTTLPACVYENGHPTLPSSIRVANAKIPRRVQGWNNFSDLVRERTRLLLGDPHYNDYVLSRPVIIPRSILDEASFLQIFIYENTLSRVTSVDSTISINHHRARGHELNPLCVGEPDFVVRRDDRIILP